MEMDHMKENWQKFSEEMVEHIGAQQGKYRINESTEVADLLPAEWALGDAMKYVYEVIGWCNDREIRDKAVPRQMSKENIMKAAHCLQIAWTKLGA
jgi:hypothetical protein